MAKPNTKAELKEYALRRLGKPVLEINVSDDQCDDAIDYTIQKFQQFHYDGAERVYLKHKITQADIDRAAVANDTTTTSSAGNSDWEERNAYLEIPQHILSVEGLFSFTDKDDQMEETLIMSDEQPAAGLLGLGAGVTVDVELVTTTGTEPGVRIQHNGAWSSWGIFPASVENGDKIQIRNKSSATFLGVITTTIKVGSRQIAPWSIITNSGPDTDADFTAPANLTNTAPNTPVVSSCLLYTSDAADE